MHVTTPSTSSATGNALGREYPLLQIVLAVVGVAFLLRFLHNSAILGDPLYWNPLGGNLPLLVAAESIAQGDLVPFDGPLSLNSPAYPYILAALYKVFGVNAFFEVRLVGGLIDSVTCGLVALLAGRHFGRWAAWGAGLAMAVYGPLIFFAVDLNPVPYTLLLLTGGVLTLDSAKRPRHFGLSGLLFGLAAATRPNVLIAGVLALGIPWLRSNAAGSSGAGTIPPAGPAPLPGGVGRSWWLSSTLALGLGLAVGVAPVTLLNVAASGRPVLLTTSAGHNFYIGHNEQAEAQYSLPAAFDGDIFESMKALAEEVEGRQFDDTEVSGWYLRRGVRHILSNPGRELELLGRRALLTVNKIEATTYANYDYQRWYSVVLQLAPKFPLLAFLALPGLLLLLRREHAHLWLPLLAGVATVLLFFYIARLRIVMIPTLGLFAGAAVSKAVFLGKRREWQPLAVAAAIGIAGFAVASVNLLDIDTSNDWNKAGGILAAADQFEDAERALGLAIEANPANADTYLNLESLYRRSGRIAEADSARALAERLRASGPADGETYRRSLEDVGG